MENSQTIGEVKKYLQDNWNKGVSCPCCGQFVKKYRIKINYFMCKFLINLYKLSKDSEYVHLNDAIEGMKTSGLYSYLPMWKLAQKVPNDDPKKKHSGLWRITEKGKAFVEGRITVPKYFFTYNNKFLGFDGEMVSIREALGTKFSYEELMKGV